MYAGEFLQQFDHPVVVFQGVQPGPRQAILPGDQIFVEGLVLVPEDDDSNLGHTWDLNPPYRRFFRIAYGNLYSHAGSNTLVARTIISPKLPPPPPPPPPYDRSLPTAAHPFFFY